MFSSGGGGVGDGNSDPATQRCDANVGANRTVCLPEFSAACPYVTSVGGNIDNVPETAVSFSGGGFSNYVKTAVSKHLDSLAVDTYEGLYNPYGHGIPDVAAQAYDFLIICQGREAYVGSTSYLCFLYFNAQ
ncbi:hypothetical protein PAXINDRAFT_13829 [Paxillus involutus ATCC 200175]|uniref:Uncharacterized protein n=1 Tax=Paxillus involutus ATCC 200175 TaxID=664439 RepID=A0A0C9U0J5_PAXIN|nr:hypothetical protein PAXINDRAFT_13829 [Paxillus involutus ATCC 200175]